MADDFLSPWHIEVKEVALPTNKKLVAPKQTTLHANFSRKLSFRERSTQQPTIKRKHLAAKPTTNSVTCSVQRCQTQMDTEAGNQKAIGFWSGGNTIDFTRLLPQQSQQTQKGRPQSQCSKAVWPSFSNSLKGNIRVNYLRIPSRLNTTTEVTPSQSDREGIFTFLPRQMVKPSHSVSAYLNSKEAERISREFMESRSLFKSQMGRWKSIQPNKVSLRLATVKLFQHH